MTAGRASALALAVVLAATVLATSWSLKHIRPAFQAAFQTSLRLEAGSHEQQREPRHLTESVETLSPAFDPAVLRWGENIVAWAAQFDLDPNLIATVMQIESCGNPQARSPAGALGLFQVMPYHFEYGEDPYDPDINAGRGLAYLRSALDLSSGQVVVALAGYNGGHGQIYRSAHDWPEETRRYVRWGSGILEDLQHGDSFSPTLEAWKQAGGASLCGLATD